MRSLGWGGPPTLAQQHLLPDGADPSVHVVARGVLGPAMTAPMADQILTWAANHL